MMIRDFFVKLVEGVANLREHAVSSRGQPVDPRLFRARGFSRAQPAALGHAREHRIQGPRAQSIAVTVELFEHPLTVHALFVGVVQDVDFPKCEQKLPDHGIAHCGDDSTPLKFPGGRVIFHAVGLCPPPVRSRRVRFLCTCEA